MKRFLASLGCVSALLLSPGFAAADEFDRPGFYLGAGASGGFFMFKDSIEEESLGLVSVEDSWGLNGRLGYRIFSWLAVEAQYERMNGFQLASQVPLVGNLARLTAHTATVNLKLMLPVWRIHPYILLGPGVSLYQFNDSTGGLATAALSAGLPAFLAVPLLQSQDTEVALAGRAGIGFDTYITRSLVFNLEASAVLSTRSLDNPVGIGGLTPLHYISAQAGLQWRF